MNDQDLYAGHTLDTGSATNILPRHMSSTPRAAPVRAASHNFMVDFGDGRIVMAHRHGNGGGIVAETASVARSAYIGRSARVYGHATVGPQACISSNASVSGRTYVIGRAWVIGSARVYGHAIVSGRAHIEENASASGYVHVGGSACLRGGHDANQGFYSCGMNHQDVEMDHMARISCNDKLFDTGRAA